MLISKYVFNLDSLYVANIIHQGIKGIVLQQRQMLCHNHVVLSLLEMCRCIVATTNAAKILISIGELCGHNFEHDR